MSERLILASASVHRLRLLQAAGLDVEAVASQLDERSVEAPLLETGAAPEDVAEILAEAKANDVSERHPEALVIGADQTLSFGGTLLHKPATMEGARRQLLALSGKTHRLTSAVALARRGEIVWRHAASADITLRKLSPTEIGDYLAKAGDAVLGSVGAYQIEGLGIRLMEKMEGDFFTIVGLPMLPLLAELRRREAIDG